MILPIISLGAYNVMIFFPTLIAVLAAKVAENSTDYSLNNTVRNMLFLPCTYEEKFSAKQAIDSFFVRMGDVLSAALVFFGTNIMHLSARQFAAVNAVLVLVMARARLAGRPDLCAAHGRGRGSGRPTGEGVASAGRAASSRQAPRRSCGPSARSPASSRARRRNPSISVMVPVVTSSTPVRSGTNLKSTCTTPIHALEDERRQQRRRRPLNQPPRHVDFGDAEDVEHRLAEDDRQHGRSPPNHERVNLLLERVELTDAVLEPGRRRARSASGAASRPPDAATT